MEICQNCSNPLSLSGYFCGKCLTQFKCKACDFPLEKEHVGCINCGEPKMETNRTSPTTNTFRLHETPTERTIEATFSDAVGKDFSGIIRDSYTTKLQDSPSKINHLPTNEEGTEGIKDAEIIDDLEQNLKEEKLANNDSANHLTLKAIAMKNLPSSELEWIVVYGFYASSFGKNTFTRQNIIERYEESNRLDDAKKSGLSMYIKRAVQAEYLNPLANDYSILEKGILKAKEIIGRTSSSSPKVKNTSKKKDEVEDSSKKTVKKSTTVGTSRKRLANIDFHPISKDSLVDYYKKFTTKTDYERNLIFTNYLTEILKIDAIGLDHLYTCYDEVGARIPENMAKSLGNTKSRTGWLESKNSNILVTTKGRNKLKFWDKKD